MTRFSVFEPWIFQQSISAVLHTKNEEQKRAKGFHANHLSRTKQNTGRGVARYEYIIIAD